MIRPRDVDPTYSARHEKPARGNQQAQQHRESLIWDHARYEAQELERWRSLLLCNSGPTLNQALIQRVRRAGRQASPSRVVGKYHDAAQRATRGHWQ